ncbi:MAG: Hsp70 family protein [Kibdelosporangium sp.]
MPYGVGIDLGTSFTSAAVHDSGGTRMVPLGPEIVAPSVVYASPGGNLLTGAAAQHAAAQGEGGRQARGFKRRLGDPTPLVLGGTVYSPAALMAAQLRDVLAQVTHTQGAPPSSVVLTCPAIWGPYRREHFSEVPRLAGAGSYRLITEPEAAAAHYSLERTLGVGEIVAVYDLGGGTFDTTVLRMRSDGMEILGTPDGIEHLGGIDFDDALLAHIDYRLGGAVSALDPADPEASAALVKIHALCVRAKEELSHEPDIDLSVPLPDGPRTVTITRLQLNEMIRPIVRLTTDALRRTISSAGLQPADLSAILLAGGSSRVPLVGQLVHDEFGKPVRAALHPKYTVALGAAAASAKPAEPPRSEPNRSEPTPSGPTPSESTPSEPSRSEPRTRIAMVSAAMGRKWVAPVAAAAMAVVVAAAATFVFTADSDKNTATGDLSSTSTLAPAAHGGALDLPQAQQPIWIYKSGPVAPYHGLIASADNWGGTDFGSQSATQTAISAAPDGSGGLRVTWTGGSAAQVYLQNVSDTADLTSYVDSGALVFDAVVNTPPAARTTLAVHCVWPCASEVDATTLLRNLPPGRKTTVKIPLKCFLKLNTRMVNTPFLVYTAGALAASFSDIRWEKGVSDATACADLT